MRIWLCGLTMTLLCGVARADPTELGVSMSAGGGLGRNLDRRDPTAGTGPAFRLRVGLRLPAALAPLEPMLTLSGTGAPSAQGVGTFVSAGLGYRGRWWRFEPHMELSVDLARSAPVVGTGLDLAFAPDWLAGGYLDYAPRFGLRTAALAMTGLALIRRY